MNNICQTFLLKDLEKVHLLNRFNHKVATRVYKAHKSPAVLAVNFMDYRGGR